jgi:tripartite-type tricarboxylate transporter receptor subunit TctC
MNIGKKTIWRWVLGFAVPAIMLCTAFPSAGADFPKGPMNFWVPFNPGGETDIEIRALQPSLEKSFGVPLVINYLPGAGGALCWSKLAAAKPDGYTIGGVNIPHIILQPKFMKDVNFKTEDFVILCLIEYTATGLAVKKDFKASTLKEFIDYARANPGKISCGGVGKFSGQHFAALQFMKMTNTRLNYVTFSGTGTLQTALMGGHIDAAFASSAQMVNTREQIKILAIGSEKRIVQLSDIPTFKELGMEFYPRTTRGVIAPKGLPAEMQKRLETAFLEAIHKPEFKAKMEQAGFIVQGLGMADSQKYLEYEASTIYRLSQEFNLLPAAK